MTTIDSSTPNRLDAEIATLRQIVQDRSASHHCSETFLEDSGYLAALLDVTQLLVMRNILGPTGNSPALQDYIAGMSTYEV